MEDLARERALASRLTERSALVELAPDPIFARDADGRITFWNSAAERAYGFTSQEALGARPQDLLHTEYPVDLEDIEGVVGKTERWEGDLIQTAKDGRRFTVASRWGAVHDRDGNLTGLLEINRDITERLEVQAQHEQDRSRRERERLSSRLVRAQRLESLGELAGGIAHDFNNLLAVILGYSDTVVTHLEGARDRLPDEDFVFLTASVSEITQASQRAAALTAQLLDFAQQDDVHPAVIDVNATITETLVLLARTLGTHIELTASLDPELDRVRIDAGQLGQILVNLAVNSRDAMPDGGRLSITTTALVLDDAHSPSEDVLATGRYVRLDVTDTGAGMSREVTDRAFDPFFTTKPVGEGTGLGLAGVYGIATRAGGQVELVSEPGVGTTITVLLPGTDAPLTTQSTPVAPAPTPPTAAGTVLIVEDEPALRKITARTLAGAGYTVLTATSSSDALVQAAGQPIALLLTDIVMPGLLGPELAEQLSSTRPSMKVLLMSGFARATWNAPAGSSPGPMLQKPFTPQALLNAISELLHDPSGPDTDPQVRSRVDSPLTTAPRPAGPLARTASVFVDPAGITGYRQEDDRRVRGRSREHPPVAGAGRRLCPGLPRRAPAATLEIWSPADGDAEYGQPASAPSVELQATVYQRRRSAPRRRDRVRIEPTPARVLSRVGYPCPQQRATWICRTRAGPNRAELQESGESLQMRRSSAGRALHS